VNIDGLVELSPEEGQALVERKVSEVFGMSLAEFLCAYESGEFDDEDPDVLHVVMLLPFARRITGVTSPPANTSTKAQIYLAGGVQTTEPTSPLAVTNDHSSARP
jgi:hypothetical protein